MSGFIEEQDINQYLEYLKTKQHRQLKLLQISENWYRIANQEFDYLRWLGQQGFDISGKEKEEVNHRIKQALAHADVLNKEADRYRAMLEEEDQKLKKGELALALKHLKERANEKAMEKEIAFKAIHGISDFKYASFQIPSPNVSPRKVENCFDDTFQGFVDEAKNKGFYPIWIKNFDSRQRYGTDTLTFLFRDDGLLLRLESANQNVNSSILYYCVHFEDKSNHFDTVNYHNGYFVDDGNDWIGYEDVKTDGLSYPIIRIVLISMLERKKHLLCCLNSLAMYCDVFV